MEAFGGVAEHACGGPLIGPEGKVAVACEFAEEAAVVLGVDLALDELGAGDVDLGRVIRIEKIGSEQRFLRVVADF